MRIGDTLKKAASLFVEVPEGSEAASGSSKEWNVMDADLATLTASQATPARPPSAAAPSPSPSPSPTAKTIEQIVKEQPGPDLSEIKPAAAPHHDVIDADGKVDYTEIYSYAALPAAPFTAEQVLELLGSLPKELPIEAKRATVKVTLDTLAKATGATPQTIVTDASRKLAALASYAKSYSEQADQFMSKSQAEIASLEQEIQNRKNSIEDAKKKQAAMVQACTTESERLDEVLEFFSLDVAPSKYA